MNRRGFLGGLAAFAAACTLDPELALWKPGAKTISVPNPKLDGISITYIQDWYHSHLFVSDGPCLFRFSELQNPDNWGTVG